MTLEELRAIIQDVRFRDWEFRCQRDGADAYTLQVHFYAPNTHGQLAVQSCRKWRISSHSTKGEVLQTALKAVITALEHEAREEFLYCGRPIYHPHIDPDALFLLTGPNSFQERLAATT